MKRELDGVRKASTLLLDYATPDEIARISMDRLASKLDAESSSGRRRRFSTSLQVRSPPPSWTTWQLLPVAGNADVATPVLGYRTRSALR